MENQALVSIIIPVYNVEKYLRECVDSALKQTYKNLEIILVDDGSTDSSGKICDEYLEKDDRITVIHQKNAGPSKTRNTGLKNAGGEYVYFLDSDDYIESNAIELLVSTAESNQADLVFFDAESFTDDGAEINQGYKIKGSYRPCGGYEMLTELHKNKDYHCAIYLLLIKHQLITDNGISFLESAYCSEDLLFTYQIYCCAQKSAQCQNTLYHRRYRTNSIVTSRKSARHFLSCRDVYMETKDYSGKIGKSSDYMATEYTVRCAYNALNTYTKLSKKDKRLCKKEFRELKKDVLFNNAFGNTALKMRCHGTVFWFVYKIFEKSAGKLLKGKK